MTNTIIEQRLAALRDVMRRESIDAFIFPSTDPHNGEYVPEHWEGRKWISGFNGSAGTAVVTMDAAALWTLAFALRTSAPPNRSSSAESPNSQHS